MEEQYVQARLTIGDQIAMEAQGCKQICIHSLQEVFTVFLS